MKKKTKKLALNRSTLRHLSSSQISRAAGGIITDITENNTCFGPCDTGGGGGTGLCGGPSYGWPCLPSLGMTCASQCGNNC